MKWLFSSLLFSFIAFGVHAQNFKGSAYIGSNWSHMRGDYMVGYNKPGVNLGFTVAYPFKEKLDLSISFSYSQKGSRRTYDKYGNPMGGTWHLMRADYFEVPILAIYKLPLFENKFNLMGGISFARLMNEHLEREKWSGVSDENLLRNWEYAFQLGVTYHKNEKYNLFFRHSTSFFTVMKDNISFIFSPSINNQPYSGGLMNFVATIGIERKF